MSQAAFIKKKEAAFSRTAVKVPGRSGFYAPDSLPRGSITKMARKAGDYYGSVRSQSRAVQDLAKMGRDPRTGRKVGKKRARRVAAHIGDWANE